MTTNYDPIAEQSKRAKQQPWRAHVEAFTLMRLIGDPAGKVVIDVACGEGFYTRMIRRRGAAEVTGVDFSEKMIKLARGSEVEQRLGIDYIVGDGRNLGLAADCDLAVAAYFLNYAHDRAELDAMCSGVAHCLKSGGRFVTMNSNPACHFPLAPSYSKYGFETRVVGAFCEGAPITWTFHLEDGPFDIENYFLSVETHEETLHAAGFRDIRGHRPLLSPDGEGAYGRDYWSDLLDHPPVIFIEWFHIIWWRSGLKGCRMTAEPPWPPHRRTRPPPRVDVWFTKGGNTPNLKEQKRGFGSGFTGARPGRRFSASDHRRQGVRCHRRDRALPRPASSSNPARRWKPPSS